ncbi:MAG: peptidoglycan-binding protein [Clostridia bacterium]|nr:peptidoglycan-binding protein [Clostridia bacterium]
MKKLIALMLVLLLCSSAMAATVDWSSMTDDEINAEITAAQAELESRGVAAEEPVEEGYRSLQKGSKGDEVKALQQRLIELNYLSGSADGDYGGKTASAVELFQSTAGLTATGIADADTQTALFADDAPKAKVYQSLDYKAMSRDPDTYEGNLYKFDGKVVQVMEQSQTDGTTLVALRVASKGRYDDVVYVIYYRGSGEARILEDDKVTVYGTSKGLYTYETVMGAEVTIPMILADSVTVK